MDDNMDGGMETDPNFEYTNSTFEHNGSWAQDYWFGERYFECVVAQDLMMRKTVPLSFRKIDVGHNFLFRYSSVAIWAD